jgi:hypothetical protein
MLRKKPKATRAPKPSASVSEAAIVAGEPWLELIGRCRIHKAGKLYVVILPGGYATGAMELEDARRVAEARG